MNGTTFPEATDQAFEHAPRGPFLAGREVATWEPLPSDPAECPVG